MKKSLYTPRQKEFAKLLVAARKNAGLNQREFAALLGRPHSVVAMIELGQRRVDVIEFLEIADHLKIDPCDIINELGTKRRG